MPIPMITAEPKDVGFDAGRLARITDQFKPYVDDGRLPGWLIAVSRNGETPYLETYGKRDLESGAPLELDTVFRFYSMTKPITSVAAMILFEEGKLELTDPVSKFIPSFADTRVYSKGPATNAATVPQVEPMTVFNLLTHTSGLTYGFVYANGIDHLYRQAGFEWGTPAGMDLATACDVWASMPLLFQPGAEWNYSVSTDVLGRIVEVVSGQTLDRFIAERITGPLGSSIRSCAGGFPRKAPCSTRAADRGATSSTFCGRVTTFARSIRTPARSARCARSPERSRRAFPLRTSERSRSSRTAFRTSPRTSSSAAPSSTSRGARRTFARCWTAHGVSSGPAAFSSAGSPRPSEWKAASRRSGTGASTFPTAASASSSTNRL